MNDITPKEAIANLNHLYGMVAPDIQRSLDVAIKALERPTGDLISRSALKKDIIESHYFGMFTENIIEVIDNAPTVSDRYDEGYAQGYVDGSTGADWKGGAE